MDAVKKFHFWGFRTSVLIGDGVSSNLSMFKTLTGHTGYYKVNPSDSQHHIKSYFTSPFTGDKIFIIICPSHMVFECKSQIISLSLVINSSSKML